ncbi:hypothetical protein [Mesorhizobium escarrei]|uniref:Amino acid transporter protein n=1 Tax=Mesorhizobium escarrei TaxID=666018 RepID=A0ABM9DSC8_9HYPH|nr:hypothetical protein [Mesorhizobium escarrei]CAH2399596.1 Putative Amino acid transporter protein [Mesorhizobium escarrei]
MDKPEKKPVSNLVHNEQVKLFAVFLNNLAVASLATGAIVPMVSLSVVGKSDLAVYIPFGIGAAIAVWFHWWAHRVLRELKE